MDKANILSEWNWKFEVFFNKEILSKVIDFIDNLSKTESETYKKILDFYLSFYSISLLLDAIESRPDEALENIDLAIKYEEKIIYIPFVSEEIIKNRILEQKEEYQQDLNYLLKKGRKTTNTINMLDFYKVIYGDDFINSCDFLFDDSVINVIDIDHGDMIESENLVNEFKKLYKNLTSDENIVSVFGEESIGDFDIMTMKKVGFAEWWDTSLTKQENSLLIIYDNEDSNSNNNFKYTIIHEVYPGHAHFYNTLSKNKNKAIDHGATSIIEGWATFAEWNSIPSDYSSQIKNNAKCFLKESVIKDSDEKAKRILERRIAQGYSEKEGMRTVIYSTQYLGFVESYYFGALWLEYYCEKKKIKPKEFLRLISDKTIGEVLSLWT